MINTIKDWVKSPEGIDTLKTTAYIGGGSVLGILMNRLFGKNNWKYDALAAILGGAGGYGIKRLNDPKFIPGSSLQEQRKQQQARTNDAEQSVTAAVEKVYGNEPQSPKEKTTSPKEKVSSPKEKASSPKKESNPEMPMNVTTQALKDAEEYLSMPLSDVFEGNGHPFTDKEPVDLNKERRESLHEYNVGAITASIADGLYRKKVDSTLKREMENARRERQIIESRPLLHYLFDGSVSRSYKRKVDNIVKNLNKKTMDILGLTKLPAISVDPAIEKAYQKLKNERGNLSKVK